MQHLNELQAMLLLQGSPEEAVKCVIEREEERKGG